jgi:phosphate transport system permease protein
MTAMHVQADAPRVLAASDPSDDQPRRIVVRPTPQDRIFRGVAGGVGALSLVIVAATAFFLFYRARPALQSSGWLAFFTQSTWNTNTGKFGVQGLLVGTFLIAFVALIVAVPISLGAAIFINEYAPPSIRRVLVSAIDLLAALPSLIFGLWGFFALEKHLVGPAEWLGYHLSALPIFRFSSIPPESLARSTFTAGVVVGIMIIPIITSVSRDVMAQVPREQCEGALALGGSRWGMVRNVILPFGRTGIIGAALLGFGRALGETIAIAIMLSITVQPNWHILETGGGSVAGWIATQFGEANEKAIDGLIAAGLALFLVTLMANALARIVVKRSTRFAS